MKWSGGKLTEAVLTAEADTVVRVRFGGSEQTVSLIAGEPAALTF